MPAFTGAADLMVTSVFPGGSEQQFFLDWGPYAATYTVDAGARLLPVLQGSPAFDPTTHTFSFTTDATGATPDFVFGSVSAFRTADARGWTWRVAAPYATSVVYPTLPTDVYDFNITAADTPGSLDLLVGKVPGGYDAARPVLLADSSNPQLQQFVTGTTGSATLERYVLLARGKARAGDRMDDHAPAPVPRLLSRRVR